MQLEINLGQKPLRKSPNEAPNEVPNDEPRDALNETASNSSNNKVPANDLIVLKAKGTANTQTKSTPLEKQFDKLWKQLQTKQRRNDQFENQVEETRNWINSKLGESRTKYQKALVQQTEKLIGHLLKKSLAQWHRTTLCDWIEENISALEQQGAPDLQNLVRTYVSNKMSQVSGRERDAIENAFDASIEDIMAELAAADLSDDEDFNEEDYLDQNADSEAEGFDDFDKYDHAAESHFDQAHRAADDIAAEKAAEAAAKNRLNFTNSMVSKLFRRTAKALHPDHEQDPQRREEKQSLMKELLHARKTGNFIKIFKLYRENVDNAAIKIDAPELQPMIDLLTHQVSELDSLYADMSRESPMHEWVKDNIVGKSKKRRLIAFDDIEAGIERDIGEIRNLSPLLKTLSKLKPLLEARYERQRYRFY